MFCFSPTAKALGSSATVKVSGQTCLWALSGSLGQIRLGLLKGSAEGSTKVSPRFHQGCTEVSPSTKVAQVSWCLWSSGADPSWAAKRFRLKRFCGRFTKVPPRFHRGSTKVSPRFHQGCASLVVSLVFWGRSFWAAKRFCGRFHQGCASFDLQNCGFLGKVLLLQKSSLEGSANCALYLSPSLLLRPKLRELLTCLTHTNPVRRKRPIMSLLLGYSLGLFDGRSWQEHIYKFQIHSH